MPPPSLGKKVDAAPINGKVFVLINGRFVPLTASDGRSGSGTEIDAAARDAVADHGDRERKEDTDRKVRWRECSGSTQTKAGASKGLTHA